jgi:ABC-type transporter MlaC component
MDVFDRIEIWSGFLLPVDLNLDLFRSVFSPWLTRRPTRPTVLDAAHELDPARILGRFEFSPGANGRSDLDSCTMFIIPADEPQEMISAFFVLDDFYAGKVIISYKGAFYANSKEGHFQIDTADMNQDNDLSVEESDIRSVDSRGPTSASRSATEGKPPRQAPIVFEAREIKFGFEYNSLVQSLTQLVTSFSITEKVYKDFNKLLVTFTRNELRQIEEGLNSDGNALKQASALSGSQPLENKIKLNMIRYSHSLAETLDRLPVPYSYLTPDFSKNPDYVVREVDDDDDGMVDLKTDIKIMPREMSKLLSNYVFDALNARIDSGPALGKIMGDKNLSAEMVAIAERVKALTEKLRRVPKQTQTKKRKAPDMLDRLDKRIKLNDVDTIQDATIVDARAMTFQELITAAVEQISQTGFAIVRNYVAPDQVVGWREQAALEFKTLLGQNEWTAMFKTMSDFNKANPTWETRQVPCLAYMKVWQAVKKDEGVKLLLKGVIESRLKQKPKSGASASPSTEKMDVSSSSESSQSKPKQKETTSTDKQLLYGIDCPWFASSVTGNYEARRINDDQALEPNDLRKYVHSAPVPAEANTIQSYMILARDVEFDTWLTNPRIVVETVKPTRTGAMYFFKRPKSNIRDLAEGRTLRDASVPSDPKKSLRENLEETGYGLSHGNFQEEDKHMCYEYRTRVGDIVLMAPSTRRRHTFNFPVGASTSDATGLLKVPFILGAPLSARLGAVKKTQNPLVTAEISLKRLLPYAADRPLISVKDIGEATFNTELSNRVDVQEAAALYLGKPYKNATQLAADKLGD